MIIDTSALIALLRGEPDAPRFADALATRAEAKRLSAANYLEAAIVIDGSRDPVASRRLDDVIARANIVIETVTAEHALIARADREFFSLAEAEGTTDIDELSRVLDRAIGLRSFLTADWSASTARPAPNTSAHELLHLRIPTHGRLFKALMTAHVPQWRHYRLMRQSLARTAGEGGPPPSQMGVVDEEVLKKAAARAYPCVTAPRS